MKNSLWFPVLLAILALVTVSCAPIQWPASSAYSDKAESGLRPDRDPSVKKQEKPTESGRHEDHHAHTDGGHHDHATHHAAMMGCAKTTERAAADIPDLAPPRWVFVDSFLWPASKDKDFLYSSYRDMTRPELAVAAVTATPAKNTGRFPLPNLSWEVGDEIRSTLIGTNKPVCVKPVVFYKGERLGLDVFYKRLKGNAAKLPPNTKSP